MITKQDIIGEMNNIQALSNTVIKLMSLNNNPYSKVSDYEQIIKYDPIITATLLKTVNSGLYHRSRNIVSLEQAIALLGIEQVYQIALSLGVIPSIPKEMQGFGMDNFNYWKHIAATAIFTEQLAQELQCGDIKIAFTAGLLHDLGKLVSDLFLKKYKILLSRKLSVSKLSFQEIETQILGVDHCYIGSVMGEEWNLPASLLQVIKYHHNPENIDKNLKNTEEAKLVKLVHLANVMSHIFGFGIDKAELKRKFNQNIMSDCNLKQSQVEYIAAISLDKIQSTIKIFNSQ